jgi:hypothetical protein
VSDDSSFLPRRARLDVAGAHMFQMAQYQVNTKSIIYPTDPRHSKYTYRKEEVGSCDLKK